MPSSAARSLALAFGLALAAGLPAGRAVIFYSTSDPSYNTTAPTGSLANSGWQWVGTWEGFTGTPIAPNYFLAARHIGGAVGDPFVFDGVTYTAAAFFDDSASDLRIVQVNGSFPTWAPLYLGSSEVGSGLVVYGYGLSRGAAVYSGTRLAGWQWGSNNGVLRWGQNTIVATINGGSYWGQLLYAVFTAGGGANGCDLAQGDSSGPVFINDGTGWKLAGIAAAVDGPFNTTDTGGGFDAAIFDARGLYIWNSDTQEWQQIPNGPEPEATGFYATQVSVRASWIQSVIPSEPVGDAPLFSGPGLALLACLLLGTGAYMARGRSCIGESGWIR
jgi:hypothetical protein